RFPNPPTDVAWSPEGLAVPTAGGVKAMAASSPTAANPMRPLLTVPDVAELLRLSPRQVRRLIAEGRLPIVRLGRAIRIRPQDVEALVAGSGQERARND